MTTMIAPHLTSTLVNRILAIKPLWNFAKKRARAMMIKRAETIGVPWRETVEHLRRRHGNVAVLGERDQVASAWQQDLEAIQNADLVYPDYYTTSFHAYDEGNLGWLPAMEVEVAAQAVHARLWPDANARGDAMLRQSYHDVLVAELPAPPKQIVDLGCGVGMSTETLQALYPDAHLTGVDLSPYFLAMAQYREQRAHAIASVSHASKQPITWCHAPAESTGLPGAAYDLVSVCLVFHELPQAAAQAVVQEARRLLRPGGHLAIMDMNPASQVYAKMPPFVLTLLKSTEPYLDEYFALDMDQVLQRAGFKPPVIRCNSVRHRTIIGQVPLESGVMEN